LLSNDKDISDFEKANPIAVSLTEASDNKN